MPTLTARRTITSMWLILFAVQSRELTEEEKNELNRLCELLQQGIPNRDIYNAVARQFCDSLRSSGVFEGAKDAKVEALLEKLDAMKLLVG